MFPVDNGAEAESARGRRTFLFDFEAGDFVTVDGKLMEDDALEAVKTWIEKTLRTEKARFKVYEDTDYGVSLMDLIGNNYPEEFVKMEIEREVREAIERHPDVRGVHSFRFVRIKRGLECAFTVDTTYGSAEVNI